MRYNLRFPRESKSYQGTSPIHMTVSCRFCKAKVDEDCKKSNGETRSAHLSRITDSQGGDVGVSGLARLLTRIETEKGGKR